MNFTNLPVFILFFAFVYLLIIYGLLKIAEMQISQDDSPSSEDKNRQIPTP
ncbi:hypothetical protein IQ255_22005 [Pleurocapsales cyanobacterium LEGE 10410]|nr:hypothetical protein [Pleurocapsales cyanobacterium LEGE 10410]